MNNSAALRLFAFAGAIFAAAPAVRAQSAAYAWGRNTFGQLGDGTTTQRNAPVAVSGLASGVTSIAAGTSFSLAVRSGAVYASGYNGNGQLGDGTSGNTSSSTPVAVNTLTSGVTSVAAGFAQSLAVQGGAAYAWGNNAQGQLGDGTTTQRNAPVAVSGLASGVTSIAAGGYHSLAVRNGTAYVWGSNTYGELGNGTSGYLTSSSTPVAVNTLTSGVTSIAAGSYFNLAVRDGVAYAWGQNTGGQLGDGTTTQRNAPVAVLSLSTGVTSVAAGDGHSLAVQNGHVFAWGNNGSGQLGNNTTTGTSIPFQVDPADLQNIRAVAAGVASSYALASDGSLWVWGANQDGQLGLGTTTSQYLTPQHLLAPAGYAYTALDSDASDSFAEAILTVVPEPRAWLGGALTLGAACLAARRRKLSRV